MVFLAKNNDITDIFKQSVKLLCKVNNISPRKPRFETIYKFVIIRVKNHLKDGVDLDCFHILNLIYRIVGPFGIKFTQHLWLFPDSKGVDRIDVSFEKKDYDALNAKMREMTGT